MIESRDSRASRSRAMSTNTLGSVSRCFNFSGYALWTYLTQPFLYAYPGFVAEEIPPWKENGETWRRLKVIFPDNVAAMP